MWLVLLICFWFSCGSTVVRLVLLICGWFYWYVSGSPVVLLLWGWFHGSVPGGSAQGGGQQPVLSCEQGTAPASILLLVFNMLGPGSILRMCNSISLHSLHPSWVGPHSEAGKFGCFGGFGLYQRSRVSWLWIQHTEDVWMNDVLQMFRGVCVSQINICISSFFTTVLSERVLEWSCFILFDVWTNVGRLNNEVCLFVSI